MTASEVSSVKWATTFEEQVEILKSRGLIVSNEDFAIRTLQQTTTDYRK